MKNLIKSLTTIAVVLTLVFSPVFSPFAPQINTVHAAVDIVNDGTLSTSLVACWDLDEESGTRFDETANNNDLTDNNTVLFSSGVIGNDADFERSNTEYLSITDAAQTGLDITGNVSISTWLTLESQPASGENMGIISKADGATDFNLTFRYRNVGGVPELAYFFVNSTFEEERFSTTLSNSTLYHIVFTLNMATREGIVYINNSSNAMNSTGSKTAALANNDPVNVGNDLSGSSRYLDGTLDITAVWSKVLTADEVSSLYNSGAGIPCVGDAPERRIINIQ